MGWRKPASRPVVTWALVAIGARLPAVMGPLALVLLVRERPGGYSFGAALGAAFVVGEVVAAPWLGTRLRAERARVHLVVGLAAGAVGFAGLGLFPKAHPAALVGLALVAGGGPAAVPGGLRVLLTHLVPQTAVARALSAESILIFTIAAASPALAAGLALGVAPYAPMLLASALALSAGAGLYALPAGWATDDRDRGGASMARTLVTAWPIYVSGAAGMSLLALTELVLPALLEQRGLQVGWSGPMLAGSAIAAALGAFVYGTRSWPGTLRSQSSVLLVGLSSCTVLVAIMPAAAAIAMALLLAGVLEAGVAVVRNLSLREALPPSALAAGYSVLYAAVGVGYTANATLAGAVQAMAAPSTAILAGVGLTLILAVIALIGEVRGAHIPRMPDGTVSESRSSEHSAADMGT